MCVRAGAARTRGGLTDLEVSQAAFDAAGDAWVEVYASERRALRTLQQPRVSSPKKSFRIWTDWFSPFSLSLLRITVSTFGGMF